MVVIWTCEFDTPAKRELLAIDLPDRIETGGTQDAWLAAAEDRAPYNR